jgi:hypothetical protein
LLLRQSERPHGCHTAPHSYANRVLRISVRLTRRFAPRP